MDERRARQPMEGIKISLRRRAVAQTLRGLREESGQSLRTTARNMAISPALLSRLENGIVIPTPDRLQALAAHYGVDPQDTSHPLIQQVAQLKVRPLAPESAKAMHVGVHIGALRERTGESQRHFARRTGMRYPTLSEIETGKRPLTPESWKKIRSGMESVPEDLQSKVDRQFERGRGGKTSL